MNTRGSITTPEAAELDWQAFRYIAGEMSLEEADQFEGRLAVDQAAREAVARSVEIAQGVASIAAEPVSCVPMIASGTANRTQPGHWSARAVTAVAVVALLLAVGGTLFRPAFDSTQIGGPTAGGDRFASSGANRLIALWTSAEAAANQSFEEAASDAAVVIDVDGLLPGEFADSVDTSQVVVPGWMLAAVAGGREGDAQHSDDEIREN